MTVVEYMKIATFLATLFLIFIHPAHTLVKAVLFDCDGVLVDTEYLKYLAWKDALAAYDLDLSMEEYKLLAGHTSKKIMELLQEMKGLPIPEEVVHLRRTLYNERQGEGVPPIKEMVDYALHLAEQKEALAIKIGVASSAGREEILINLRSAGIEQIFDLILSGKEDLSDYSDSESTNKPKPYIYIEAAKRLDVAPEHCVVFEDTAAGIEAASGAGMIAIAVPNWITEGQDFSKAYQIIHSISEFKLLINSTQ